MMSAWLTDAWNWIVNNPLFSGAGGLVIVSICGSLFGKKQHGQQTATAENCGSIMQATEGGKNYSANDGGTVIINECISQKEFREFLATYNEGIEKRHSEYMNELYNIVASTTHLQQKLSLPEIQFSIHNAAIQYIKDSDEETRKLLLKAVKMRLEASENSIITANMDLIVSNILLLTNTQIKIIFSLCALRYFQIKTINIDEFIDNIEEIANEILLCQRVTTVDLNGIIAHGFMVIDSLSLAWSSEIRPGHDMVQCNQKIFEENSFDISEHEKVSVLVSNHFKKLHEASKLFTELNYKRLSCTYSGIILTDLIFSLKFPHIKHAHLEDILDSLK